MQLVKVIVPLIFFIEQEHSMLLTLLCENKSTTVHAGDWGQRSVGLHLHLAGHPRNLIGLTSARGTAFD